MGFRDQGLVFCIKSLALVFKGLCQVLPGFQKWVLCGFIKFYELQLQVPIRTWRSTHGFWDLASLKPRQ